MPPRQRKQVAAPAATTAQPEEKAKAPRRRAAKKTVTEAAGDEPAVLEAKAVNGSDIEQDDDIAGSMVKGSQDDEIAANGTYVKGSLEQNGGPQEAEGDQEQDAPVTEEKQESDASPAKKSRGRAKKGKLDRSDEYFLLEIHPLLVDYSCWNPEIFR